MAEVKLKEEQELWEPTEVDKGRIHKDPDCRAQSARASLTSDGAVTVSRFSSFLTAGVQSPHEAGLSLVCKDEPMEIQIKEESFPVIVSVMSEKEESGSHEMIKEEDRDGDGSSSDTDDSGDWTPSADHLTDQLQETTLMNNISEDRDPDKPHESCRHGRGFRTHRRVNRVKDGKPYIRPNRAKRLSQNGLLTRDGRIHLGDRLLVCTVCSKSFTKKNQLTCHTRSHTGEKPFSCTVCRNTFSRNSHLKRHMRTHTGEKPFSCPVCLNTFSRNSHLKTHMRTHTGEKPFSCSVCQNTFSRNSHLKAHMRTHTGEKPFRCTVCGMTFSQSNNLKTHMRTHTGEKPFRCTVCMMSFAQNCNRRKHMETHSGEKTTQC